MTIASNDSPHRIIKTAPCGKICTPDEPELTYEISQHIESNAFFIRITDNTSGGFFSNQWIPIEDIIGCIEEYGPGLPFKALIFKPLYESTGANNHGFLAAALRSEGLLLPYEKGIYSHTQGDVVNFRKAQIELAKVELAKVEPANAAMAKPKAKSKAVSKKKAPKTKAKPKATPKAKPKAVSKAKPKATPKKESSIYCQDTA